VRVLFKLVLTVVVVAAVVSVILANFGRDPDSFHFLWRLNSEPPLDVRFSAAGPARVMRTIEAPGRVEADVEVKISAQVMGRIVKLPVKEGETVKEGDLLVQLDQNQYKADVHSAESRVERLKASIRVAEADLVKSRRDLETSQRLYTGRAASQTEMVDYHTLVQKDLARVAMSKAELVEAEAALARAKEDLERTTIRSTLNGIVSQLLAKEGEVVIIGTMNNAGTVIMSVSDPNTMVVRARIDENNIPSVQPGQKALVHFQNNARLTLTGKVLRISPKGTKGTGAAAAAQANDNEAAIFETIISLDAPPPQVRLGMTASVEILVEERDAVVSVPAPSVLHRRARDLPRAIVEQAEQTSPRGPGVKDPSKRYHQVVFVVEDGKARARLVTTGISDENRVEILAGLNPGETIVAGPYRIFDKLKDGKPIKEMAETEENE
jgi:HlyD family secretion protein